MRLDRLSLGNPGDVKPVREGISEMRIDYGPTIGLFHTAWPRVVIVSLAGGDKRTQNGRY
jgi:putative addiction module killer protein